MKLMEFFGKNIDPSGELEQKSKEQNMGDDLFWYIVDHDRLHKDFFHPTAKKIKNAHEHNKLDREAMVSEFMPMVIKGCKEYYHHAKLPGHIENIFTEELRKDMCERLYDHYREDIIKGHYKLGQ